MEVLRGMGLEPLFMPDPTLLLSCDDWSELATGEGLGSIPEKYVLLYTLNSEQKLLDRALEVAGRLGISVVCLHYNTKDFPGVLNVRDVGPGAFLELVRRAAFVCTDSFHGACFSLNFNKQFVVKTSEAAVQSNVRITDLLARYGIEDCLYAAGEPSAYNVDYDRANQVLDRDRADALSFIAECIGFRAGLSYVCQEYFLEPCLPADRRGRRLPGPKGRHRSVRLRGQRPGDLPYPVHRIFCARGGWNIGCGDVRPVQAARPGRLEGCQHCRVRVAGLLPEIGHCIPGLVGRALGCLPGVCFGGRVAAWEIVALTFLLGAKVVVDFFSLSKYRVFLTADKKNWLIQLASTVYTLLNTVIIIVFSYLRAPVVAVYALALAAVFARSAILAVYTRRRYPEFDCKVDCGDFELPQRWDALFLQILGAVQSGAPVILATVLCGSMSEVSVLAVYLLISNGLQMIPNVLGTGLQASFGRQIADGDYGAFRASYRPYRALVYSVSAVACGCAFSLILPFVDLYAGDFRDADYHNALLGFLVVLNVFLYHGKSSQGLLVIAAGMYHETRWQTCMQALIIVVLGIPLTMGFGIVGTIAASCVSNAYRVVDLLLFEPTRISRDTVSSSLSAFGLYVLQTALIAMPGYLLSSLACTWTLWAAVAAALVLWASQSCV